MTIIVAERNPIIFSAIESLLRDRKLQVTAVSVRDRTTLLRWLRTSSNLVVLSNNILPGYTTNEQLAQEVKGENPGTLFVVYDGVIQNYSSSVDFRIPAFVSNGRNTFAGHIVDFLSERVFTAGSGVYVQLVLSLQGRSI